MYFMRNVEKKNWNEWKRRKKDATRTKRRNEINSSDADYKTIWCFNQFFLLFFYFSISVVGLYMFAAIICAWHIKERLWMLFSFVYAFTSDASSFLFFFFAFGFRGGGNNSYWSDHRNSFSISFFFFVLCFWCFFSGSVRYRKQFWSFVRLAWKLVSISISSLAPKQNYWI